MPNTWVDLTELTLSVPPVARAETLRVCALLLALGLAGLLGPALAVAAARRRRSSRSLREALAAHEEATRSLREREEELRRADHHREEFLGVLSHELRNALAPIRSSVHLLDHSDPTSDEAARARDVIGRQVNHLARLVDDLLDVKRISSGKLRLRSDRIDLTHVVHETVECLRPLFVARSLSLELALPGHAIWVRGDGTRLAQVVTNLLHNASKFTESGGHVSVTVEARDREALLRVRDDGVGVPPEMLDKLFERFVQSDRTLDRTGGGLGLGLFLVRGIVELHGGTVAARSEGARRGAEFVVGLPATEPGAAANDQAVPAPRAERRRVLIVEDNVDAAESLRDVVEVIGGHEVTIARDGGAGVAAALQHLPDIVLCDLDLPVFDGYEVARRLRASGVVRGATLVALSGYASAEDVERAARAGFDFHLAKPASMDAVLRLVADARSAAAPRPLATGGARPDLDAPVGHAQSATLGERGGARRPDEVWDALRSLQKSAYCHQEYD